MLARIVDAQCEGPLSGLGKRAAKVQVARHQRRPRIRDHDQPGIDQAVAHAHQKHLPIRRAVVVEGAPDRSKGEQGESVGAPLDRAIVDDGIVEAAESDCDTVRAGGGNRAAVGDCVTVTPSADGDTVRAGRMDRPGVNKVVAVEQEDTIAVGAGAPADRDDAGIVDGVA